jgi:hypothetical protein
MKHLGDDQKWQADFSELKIYRPRPGYEQRFWAQVDGAAELRPGWKWLPVGAVLAGLLLGLGVGQYRAQATNTALAGPELNHVLSDGSLAGQFTIVK